MDRSEGVTDRSINYHVPEVLCTICYIIPKIHWFLCVYMKFEKVNISNNSVWKYHGRLKLLHTSVCCWLVFCFFSFFGGVYFFLGGGLYCFNFLSFTLYCLKVMKFACTSHLFRCEAWHKKIVIWHQDLLSKSFQSLPGIFFLVGNSWMFLLHTSLHF